MAKQPIKKSKPGDIEDQLLADLQRIQAEFINFKRRSEQEKARAVLAGKEQAVIALLPVLDNIERAIAHEPEDIKDHAWVKGITAVAVQLEAQLANMGLHKIGVVGEPFDPTKHEAISMAEGEGDAEVISAVMQNGYQFDEQVIRPAMVQVKRI